MTRREVVIEALEFRRPPWVPWSWGMTSACREKMKKHLGTDEAGLIEFAGPHLFTASCSLNRQQKLDDGKSRDAYGVVWQYSPGEDIGTPLEWPIRRPEDLDSYAWPDFSRDEAYADIPARLAARRDRFSRYLIGFSLYERAWAMRGMVEVLTEMIERPEFIERLLDGIVESNLVQIRRALTLGVDAVAFGDDYGTQTGLIMGPELWRRFIRPRLARMFAPVREAGKYVFLHSCGNVAEIFDDLLEIGLNCFNPFQPEVMDTAELQARYRNRLAFHGGMSVQQVLPRGTPEEVRRETQRLLESGREGGYIFSPSHTVPPDVPPENLVAMMEVVRAQPGLAEG